MTLDHRAADLLGKLRALEERIDSAEYVEERIFDFADLANLLPQIIAQIERLTTDRDEAQRNYIACIQRYTAIGG